jgi:endonuclease/exonuclease/phosphatase family metal-dependent hydrolase
MQLLTWNTNFCWEKQNHDWKKFTRELIQNDFDFVLLQEINPFFVLDIDYKTANGSVHYFRHKNKNVYYHELSNILSQERPNDIFWGTAIITNENIETVKIYFYDEKNNYIGSNYFGYETLMCYDFELKNNNIITIINYYKKADACKAKYNGDRKCINLDEIYHYEDSFFSDISKIVNNKNIVIFAGDFNVTKRREYDFDINGIIKKIEKMGFINKTKHIGSTMLEYDNQNDYIFVNNSNSKAVSCGDKIYPPKSYDHFGIKCNIEI